YVSNATLIAKREELAFKQARLKRIFDEAGPSRDMSRVTSLSGSNTDKVNEIRSLNEQLGALSTDIELLGAKDRSDALGHQLTNAAAETAENSAYPESALQLTERTSAIQKIPTFLPVTDEQLEDVEQVRGYLTDRLVFMIRQRLDAQVLNGNGTAPNLKGILN